MAQPAENARMAILNINGNRRPAALPAAGDWKFVEKKTTTTKETQILESTETSEVLVTAKTQEVETEVQVVNLVVQDEDEIEILSEAFSLQRFNIRDIDAGDIKDTSVPHYVQDIAGYLFKLEVS